MKFLQFSNLKSLFYRLIRQLELYSQRSRTRKHLLEMDDYALKDIGLSRQQALQEAERYFWQGDAQLSADICTGEQISSKKNLIKLSQGV
jgi:uncharacterized protein YjiS (DUF1127 family)